MLSKPQIVQRMHSDADAMLAAANTLLKLTPSSLATETQRPFITSGPTSRPALSDIPRFAFVSSAEDSSDESELSDQQSEFTTNSYFPGTTSLALSGDEESLSPIHCFMRKYCVEVFTAAESDVTTPRGFQPFGSRVAVHQVGIRCIHCKDRAYADRQERSVCFPSSLKNIYHSIETWQRRHSLVCQDIPDWIKSTMVSLMGKSKTGAGGRRKYWEEAAISLGMADTPEGIRFVRTPGELGPCIASDSVGCRSLGVPVVKREDRELVTGYLFHLLDQMEVCSFTEDDRSGGRSKVKNCPVGYPGMQCKHCGGKAGFGRYFPASCQALTSANSDRNIHNHLTKCRRFPAEDREKLELLHGLQHTCKNRRGSRKEFFRRVWGRLHESEP